MIPNYLKFTVKGEPVGKGRPRFTRSGHAYTPAKTTNYETLIKLAFQENFMDWEPTEKCVYVDVIGYYQAPKSIPKKMQPSIASEHLRYAKKCDADNLLKIVLDGLNGLAWKDDKQVTDVMVRKRYSPNPRVEISIEILGDEAE